jgi:tetratricopeptide (TPR) repeat protein
MARTTAFWLVLLATPLLLLGVLEAAARLAFAGRAADDAYLDLVDVPSFLTEREVEGERFLEVTHPEAYRERRVRFPARKPEGTVRIFCLGGSASAGWPHPAAEIHSEYLRHALERSHPDRRFEVLNVSAHAYAAYRVRLLFDEVIDFDPDVVVLYSGNNEFLERRSYLRDRPGLARLRALANRSALFRLLRGVLVRAFYPENSLSAQRRERVRAGVLSKLRRETIALREDPQQFERLKSHYASSIEAMLDAAHLRGVPVVLATVPVNLRDWRPNASHNGLSDADRERWREIFDAGRAGLLRGDPDAAIHWLEQATALEPLHAESIFLLGRAWEARGDFPTALECYMKARDLDYNPFRALSHFNHVLREFAAKRPDVFLADLEAAFLEASAPRAPGFDLLLDYVHPNQAGNRIIARTLFETLHGAGLLEKPTGSPHFSYEAAPFHEDGSPYDERRDPTLHRALLGLMLMMHQYEASIAEARLLASMGSDTPRVRRVLEVFPAYLELERRRLLGLPFDAAEAARVEALHRGFYERLAGPRPGAPPTPQRPAGR